jgi:single-strand DNA-binding protein
VPRSLNRVMLIGQVGRDPELRHTPAGVPVATFSLATTRRWLTPEGERHEATDWFNVIAWRRLAEVCRQHLGRGARVYVEGRLETHSWQEANGAQQHRTEVVATDIILLDDTSREFDAPELHYEDYLGD